MMVSANVIPRCRIAIRELRRRAAGPPGLKDFVQTVAKLILGNCGLTARKTSSAVDDAPPMQILIHRRALLCHQRALLIKFGLERELDRPRTLLSP